MKTEMVFSKGNRFNPGFRGQSVTRICLLETMVAGFQYHDGSDLDVQVVLATGQDLILVREPFNEYDARAIAIHTFRDDKVGYIPREKNTILAAMLDQGLPLFAEIVSFDPLLIEEAPWDCIRIRVYMLAPCMSVTSLFAMNCPRCSAPLQLDVNVIQVKCAYCGSVYMLMI